MGQSSIGQWAAPVFAFYNEKSAISEPPEVARSFTELSLGPLGQPVRHCIWVAVGLPSMTTAPSSPQGPKDPKRLRRQQPRHERDNARAGLGPAPSLIR